jgi:hypothetical protein
LLRAGEQRFSKHRPPIAKNDWVKVVGLRIASRAEPLRLEARILTVGVASSAWAHELSLLAQGIIERLRAAGLDVAELRFRVTPVRGDVRPVERRRVTKVPRRVDVPLEVKESLKSVADDELRDVLSESASRNLAWQVETEHVPTAASQGARVPPTAEEESDPPPRSWQRKV